jgi:hypothetical protein
LYAEGGVGGDVEQLPAFSYQLSAISFQLCGDGLGVVDSPVSTLPDPDIPPHPYLGSGTFGISELHILKSDIYPRINDFRRSIAF